MSQNESWRPVTTETYRSLYSEQMVCSMSTQLFHIPETKDLRGNEEMHRDLIPASYHRVTAAGSAQRLFNGEYAPSIVKTLMDCIENAQRRDRGVRAGLTIMRTAAPATYQPFIQTIIGWQNSAERHLQNAKQYAMRMTAPTR
ncbi:hypothetical protein [Salinithrix halophila]|uniref:Uncharacterized protein n=1 Tax=Salinithrix halophila TaxID=1485204 RepID=A0ABV8JGC8_9BACL